MAKIYGQRRFNNLRRKKAKKLGCSPSMLGAINVNVKIDEETQKFAKKSIYVISGAMLLSSIIQLGRK